MLPPAAIRAVVAHLSEFWEHQGSIAALPCQLFWDDQMEGRMEFPPFSSELAAVLGAPVNFTLSPLFYATFGHVYMGVDEATARGLLYGMPDGFFDELRLTWVGKGRISHSHNKGPDHFVGLQSEKKKLAETWIENIRQNSKRKRNRLAAGRGLNQVSEHDYVVKSAGDIGCEAALDDFLDDSVMDEILAATSFDLDTDDEAGNMDEMDTDATKKGTDINPGMEGGRLSDTPDSSQSDLDDIGLFPAELDFMVCELDLDLIVDFADFAEM